MSISIHAPLARCDLSGFPGESVTFLRFQSTHLLRGATSRKQTILYHLEFQSTHLLRGATEEKRAQLLADIFQSTHLLRGATWI